MNLRLPSSERLTYYAIMLFGLIALALMSSCAQRPTLIEYTNTDTTYTTVTEIKRDTVIIIERTEAIGNFDIDSLIQELKQGRVVKVQSNGQANLKMYVDSMGRIVAEAKCEQLEKEIELLNKIIENHSQKTRTIVDITPEKAFPWNTVIISMILALLIYAIIRFLLK